MSDGSFDLVLVANARLPSQRAQSLQVAQAAASFARAGRRTLLLVARRTHTPALPAEQDAFDYYGVPAGARPVLERVPCVDWIDRLPRRLQYVPSRLQELSFSRGAARRALAAGGAAICREIECARHLLARGHPAVFAEIHRVPGGRLRRRWLAEVGGGARGILAISGGVREGLIGLGLPAERIRVEHDALEPARFADLPGREEARRGLGLEGGGPLVVYTGGLMEWKGVDLLVEESTIEVDPALYAEAEEALERERTESEETEAVEAEEPDGALPEVRFAVAGGMDADVEALRRLAAGLSNLRVDGFQPPGRIPLYLAAADLGVVPNRSRPAISARYTSPLKIFEAMAAGLPLVASDLPSLRELLEPGQDALLVPPDDAAALAEGIRRLLADGELRRRMRARLLERAVEHTWDARAARILDWMRERGCESST